MTTTNDIRGAVLAAFQAVHEAQVPTIKVNYPNLPVIDLEHQTDPFVSLHLDLYDLHQAALGESELLLNGFFYVYYYFQEGTGTASACQYTDILNDYLCMRQTGAIRYEAAKPTNIKTFTGWEGIMNTIQFSINSE